MQSKAGLTFLQTLFSSRWWQGGLLLVLLLITYLYWLAVENANLLFGLYHDDAVYMTCGKALADGDGYRIISLPGEPPQSKYPIGFSLLLAIFWKMLPAFPANLISVEVAMAAVAIASAGASVLYLIKTRKLTVLLGLVIFLASVFNENYSEIAPMILSDFLCILLVVLALWRTEIVSRKPASTFNAILLGLIWAAPVMVRLHALAMVIACSIYLVLKRRFNTLAKALLVCLCICIPQLVWQISNARSSPEWLGFYTGYFPNPKHDPVSPGIMLELLARNVKVNGATQAFVCFPFLPNLFLWSAKNSISYVLFYAGNVILNVAVAIGLLRSLARKQLLGLYWLCIGLPAFVWPIQFDLRYLLPFLPFIYYLYYLGFRLIGKWLKYPARRIKLPYRLFTQSLTAIAGTYLVLGAAAASMLIATEYKIQRETNPVIYSPQSKASEYTGAYQWIRENTKISDVVACNNGPLLFLYTGRQGIPPWRVDFFNEVREKPITPSPMEVIEFARPAYLMDDPMHRLFGSGPSPVQGLAYTLAVMHPDFVTPVFESPHKLIRIYELNYEKLPIDLQKTARRR